MARITNNLFEAIQKVTAGEVVEGSVDKAHYCATHVEHAIFGEGICIAEAHADPDADGNIEWYTVQFKDGVRKVYAEAMKVKKAKMHEHVEVTDEMIDQEVADLSDEEFEETLQEALALDEASYSAKAARAGKDIGKPGKMFGKIAASAAKRYGSAERGKKVAGAVLAKLRAKNMEEGAMSDLDADRKDRAYQTRQAKTTMKHIINSDQGSQYTSEDWIKRVKDLGIKISMTGKGRCNDNAYIERFWRTLKYEWLKLKFHSTPHFWGASKKMVEIVTLIR